MKINSKCPECGNLLSAKSMRCQCGWILVEQHNAAQSDHRCKFSAAKQRCPLPGTTCPYPYGTGPWYCAEHARTLGNPEQGEKILNEAKLDDTRKKKLSWREELFINLNVGSIDNE
jgi:hypothetical protein